MNNLKKILKEQIEDEGLWFIDPRTAAEAYLQYSLRKLHAAIELEIFDSKDDFDKWLLSRE